MENAIFSIDQYTNIASYGVGVEYMCLSIALIMIFFMLFTRPKNTHGFPLLFFGLVTSVIEIFLVLYLVNLTDCGYLKSLTPTIQIVTWLVVLAFGFILQALYVYTVLLGHNRRRQKKCIFMMTLIYQIIYLTAAAILYIKGYLVEIQNENLQIIGLIKFLTLYGIAMYLLTLVASFNNRKNIARFVLTNIYIFSSIDVILLLYQYFTEKTILISASYVISFTIFYMLHHSNPVDEITGCQNVSSLKTSLKLLFATKNEFAYAHMSYPQVALTIDDNKSDTIESAISRACNYIFKNIKNVSMYQYSATDFIVLKKLSKDETERNREYDRFVAVLSNLQETTTNTYDEITYAKYILFKSDTNIKSIKDVKDFVSYMNLKYIKKGNKNQFVLAEPQNYKGFLLERKVIEIFEDIRENKKYKDPRIVCYAQPILNVDENKYKTAEALVRLQINGVNVPPIKFIPIAEERGYIHSLSLAMIHKVAEAINNELKDSEFDAITINISAGELSDEQFAAEVLGILDSYNISYDKIRLEITESAMFEDTEIMTKNIRKLKDSGIRFYLDDYGTGYSNLDRMTDSEFSTIKFDKSIFYKALANKETEEILDALISLVKKRGINTLVEGVETITQVEFAVNKGFESIQGYYYSRPVPIENLVDYFNKKQ